MKRLSKISILILILLSLFTLTSCKKEQLSAPINISIDEENNLIWDSVIDAKSYTIYFVNKDNNTTTFETVRKTSYSLQELEEGDYDISIGASSKDIWLKERLHVKGTTTVVPYEKEKCELYFKGDVSNVPNNQFAYVLGRDIPDGKMKFHKKKRIIVNYYTTVEQLRYAKGFAGRFFAWGLRVGIGFMKVFNPKMANTMIMGVYHLPMRGLSRMTGGAIHWSQLDGLIMMFNGHFFKGWHKFRKEGRAIKKEKKMRKKTAKTEQNN